jgi:transcriptional regulator with XRE-family HTH domain
MEPKVITTKMRKDERLFRQEQTILDITELICRIMNEDGISQSQLAERLGKSQKYVSRLLNGDCDVTMRIISDVFFACSRTVHFYTKWIDAPEAPNKERWTA